MRDPVLHPVSAERAIERECRLVPVEHRPLEASEVLAQAARREIRQQRTTDAVASHRRSHEQVFEIDAMAAAEGREAVEPEREARDDAVLLREIAEHTRRGAEQRRMQALGGGVHFMQQTLVVRELADQRQDLRNIRRGGGAQRQHPLRRRLAVGVTDRPDRSRWRDRFRGSRALSLAALATATGRGRNL